MTRRPAALAFLAAFVALFAQILVHRMVSAKLLNNFAFLVISLTMLGFAASGVYLSRRLPAMLEDLDDHLLAGAALFALAFVAAAALFYRAPNGDEFVAADATRPASEGRFRVNENARPYEVHFRRKRPKNARAGCLLCKPHKANGACPAHRDMRFGNRRRYESGSDPLRCAALNDPVDQPARSC